MVAIAAIILMMRLYTEAKEKTAGHWEMKEKEHKRKQNL